MARLIHTENISNFDVLRHIYIHGSAKTRSKWPILSVLFILYILCTISEPFIYQQIIDITIESNETFLITFYERIIYYI